MLKDITIGQYYPTDSIIHKLDPRVKFIFILAYIIMLFVISNYWGLLFSFVIILFTIILSKIPIMYVLKGFKALVFIILFTFILNVFMTPGEPIWEFYFLKITEEGIDRAFFMGIRLILLVMGTSILTLSTSPIALTDGMEKLLSVVPFMKNFAHEISMMISIALRFIPTLMEETEKIMNAQKSRGADFESGNVFNRAKALIPVLIPLFISAFQRADDLATAMEARCYRGGKNRTRLKELEYQNYDYIAYILIVCYIAGVIFVNRLT